MQAAKIEFWYDFASTYSYLSAMRIEALAAANGLIVEWKPFLLGPIFKAQGWDTSPFNIYPAKGRYMIRDIKRSAAALGLPFHAPEPFPQHSLAAARMALAAAEYGAISAFTRAVFTAQFAEARNIGDPATLLAALQEVASTSGLDVARISARSGDTAIKEQLRAQSAEASRLGLFGAPSFRTIDGELFWGDDRLDQAVAWAQATADG